MIRCWLVLSIVLPARLIFGAPTPPKEIRIVSSKDGNEQPAMFWAPTKDEAAEGSAYPLIVSLHSWSTGYASYDAYPSTLAGCQKRAWAFISPHFRGGNTRPEACGSDLAVQDVLDAVDYAKAHARIDSRKVFAVGSAHMPLVLAHRAPTVWAGVSAWLPITDLAALHRFNRSAGLRFAKPLEQCCGGPPGTPGTDAEYRRRSPLFFLETAKSLPIDINVGIFDGHKGEAVPIDQSLRAFNALATVNGHAKAALTEAQILELTSEARIPADLAWKGTADANRDFNILFRRSAGPVRLTVFNEGHVWDDGRNAEAEPALDWIAQQLALPPPATGSVDFDREIRPILENNCYKCHGAKKQKGGLRLDVAEDALRGGDAGAVIVPGRSAESVLIHNVAGLDPDALMPPDGDGDRLSAQEISKLRAWIDAGAVWPESADKAAAKEIDHWAFRKPEPPKIPVVTRADWPRTPIDAFVLARLEKEKINPSAEADRITLARRVSFDLVGLPPTPQDVTTFVSDTRPDAYERLVDRLLASPHFGERWARHWLDLARFADSDGYERDNPRPYAHLFRDWVIDAINRDEPFDQFTLEQLAGDLLPASTLHQKIATGFHRQTLTNRENGVDKEEFRNKAIVDRASTTSAVWLGLTLACAECHTHKYDPITQREFYQIFAFFNDASEKDIPAAQPDELAAYERELATWTDRRAKLEAEVADARQKVSKTTQAEWEKSSALPTTQWTVLKPTAASSEADNEERPLKIAGDSSLSPAPGDKTDLRFRIEAAAEVANLTGFRFDALHTPARPVGRGPNGDFAITEFSVAARIEGRESEPILLSEARADFASPGHEADKAIDGDSETGWSIAPQTHLPHAIVFATKEPLRFPAGTPLIFKVEQRGASGLADRFTLSATASNHALGTSMLPDEVAAALTIPSSQRSSDQQAALDRYYFERVYPRGREITQALSILEAAKPKPPETTAAILVAEERATHVHLRGDFLRKGDAVQPGTLAALHPFKPRGPRADRLDLANWLVDRANPLTARVAVNQVWKNLFGRGLVPTTDDFGVRGEKPSHPELLDWLALAYESPDTKSGGMAWSRKALIRMIVTSTVYRQSSQHRPDLSDTDPNNVLLARQNRNRLDAESVRDTFLSTSGLLNASIGGPSIRPRLPAELGPGYFSSVTWAQSNGADQYRRGLYIFYQRTLPYPALMTFDAPDSSMACTRRERSNTPLQALTLLNDSVFFECAQVLGRRIAREPGSVDRKISRVYELCLSRDPAPNEVSSLRELREGQRVLLENSPGSAEKIVGAPESPPTGNVVDEAAWVLLCRSIMTLDEFITRE